MSTQKLNLEKGFTPTPSGVPKVRGFTLLELLVVIAILAVLAAVTVVVINPAELLRQARDATRVASLKSLETAIGKFLVDGRGAPRGVSNIVYISLPDPVSTTCASHPTLPGLPSGWEYRCVTAANLQRIDGDGWIPIDFTILAGGSPLATLPIDPVNNATHYFAYVTGDSYALTAMAESERFLQRNANRDGGTDPARIEAGTSRALWARATGLVGYWPFENNFQDVSGLANHGSQTGGVTFAAGRQGLAGRFDGVDDVVQIPGHTTLDTPGGLTVSAWIFDSSATTAHSLNKDDGTSRRIWIMRRETDTTAKWHIWNSAGVLHAMIPANTWVMNQWFHIVGTARVVGGNIIEVEVFFNGVSRGTTSFAGTAIRVVSAQAINFSRTLSAHTKAQTLDEVRIYNRALTAGEIRAIFEATR